MRITIALWLALLLCPALSAQEVPLARPAARPCPALLRRVDHWISQLGEAIKPRLRKQLHARLRASGTAGVMRMAAALMPAHDRLQRAQKAKAPETGRLLTRVLDLITLLGESHSPKAFPVLMRAAESTGWTNTLRRQALLALGRLSDPRALTMLRQMLQDPELGYTAGRAVLSIERFEAVTIWIDLLDSTFQDVKVGAHDALKKWSGERMEPVRQDWRRFFRQYPEGFKKLPGYKSEK